MPDGGAISDMVFDGVSVDVDVDWRFRLKKRKSFDSRTAFVEDLHAFGWDLGMCHLEPMISQLFWLCALILDFARRALRRNPGTSHLQIGIS